MWKGQKKFLCKKSIKGSYNTKTKLAGGFLNGPTNEREDLEASNLHVLKPYEIKYIIEYKQTFLGKSLVI